LNRFADRPILQSLKSKPTLTTQKTNGEIKRRNKRKKEPIKFKMKLSPRTKRTLKSIGTGKNLKKKKIAKN